jgi:hypothetical protein
MSDPSARILDRTWGTARFDDCAIQVRSTTTMVALASRAKSPEHALQGLAGRPRRKVPKKIKRLSRTVKRGSANPLKLARCQCLHSSGRADAEDNRNGRTT